MADVVATNVSLKMTTKRIILENALGKLNSALFF